MNENLQRFKDCHLGDRCFVIGNGPSLNKTNLDLLDGEYSIAMNRVSMIYPKTVWRPTYYLFCSTNINNPDWGDEWKQSVDAAVDGLSTISFIWSVFRNRVEPNEKIVWFDVMSELGCGAKGSFSTDITKYIDKSGTSMNAAMQIVSYMGFKKIYILGADMNWVATDSKDGDPNHFDSTYKADIADGQHEYDRMHSTHVYAYEKMKELGIEVYNATIETQMKDVYPLVEYEELF